MASAMAAPYASSSALPSSIRLPAAKFSPSLFASRRPLRIACHNAPDSPSSSGSCCGGSGNGAASGGGGCSSHGKAASSLANVGKEFEHMVATSTLLEFEKNYDTAQMQGTITRDIMEDVMNTFPEASAPKKGERFLDVEALLSEASGLSKGDFIFEDDLDEMIV